MTADPLKSVLGKGSYGVVVKAVYGDSPLFQIDVAVKVMIAKSGIDLDRDYEKLQESVSSEVRILQEIESKLPLQSEHMIKIIGVADGDLPPSFHAEFGTKKALGIVMRLEAGGTLATFLVLSRGLRMIDRLHIVLQLVRAVAELHTIWVIHGDIKPENILLSHHNPPFVRLGDFGQSTFSSSSSRSALGVSTLKSTLSKHGTPLYSAPELLLVDVLTGARAKPSRRSDVYAMGLVIYEMLCSVHASLFPDVFDEQQLIEQVARLDRRPLISKLCPDTPASIAKLIELCWHKDRSLRPSALECYTKIDHCYNILSSSSYDIFLSHPWTKKPVLRHVKRYFASIGYKVWYDEEAMQWDLKRSMEDGILKSKVVLACISKDYESSRNCMFELSEASKIAGKPIITLSTDANPFSWVGTDTRFGDLKQLCDINGQGKMFVDVGDICSHPGWTEPDDSLIPRFLIDALYSKLSDLVKYLRGSQINCAPSLTSSNSSIDALYELKIKADVEAWNMRRANQPITSALDVYRYLSYFDNIQDISVLGGEALIVSQLALINGLQIGNKAFNEELVRSGSCEQLASMLHSKLMVSLEGILVKIFSIINFLCRYDGVTFATNIDANVVRLGQCGLCELTVKLLNNNMNSAAVTEHICMSIRSMAYPNADNQVKLATAGCCEALVGILIRELERGDVLQRE